MNIFLNIIFKIDIVKEVKYTSIRMLETLKLEIEQWKGGRDERTL